MAAQRGKDLLIKIGDGGSPETFTTVAGLRATTLSFNAQTVDVTNNDSVNMWRELLANSGVVSSAISGSGVFKDAASRHPQRFLQSGPDRLANRDPQFRHRRGAVQGHATPI